MRLALAGRDRTAPSMAETIELAFDAPAGMLAARCYRPAGAVAGGPGLVFFHGGGFVISDLASHDALCRRLAHAARIAVIAAAYRLALEAPFPAQVDDGLAAARWALDRAPSLGVDPARLSLGGDSAGAYIAVAVTRRLNAERRDAIAGQVLIYPLLQLEEELWASAVLADARVLGRLAVRYIRAQLKAVAMPAPSLPAGPRSRFDAAHAGDQRRPARPLPARRTALRRPPGRGRHSRGAARIPDAAPRFRQSDARLGLGEAGAGGDRRFDWRNAARLSEA